MTDREKPYSVPKEPGRYRAITLAAAVHLALLLFFWIGIDWQSETPQAIKAEIWDMQTREAAPLPPAPEPKPEPKSVVQETPKPEPKQEPVTPPPPKVDIALEQEKKRKEQKRKDPLAKQEKLEKEKKQKKEQDRKLAEEKKNAEQQKQVDLEKKKKQDALDAKLREQARAEEMKRLTGAVGSGRADPNYMQKIAAKIRSNTVFNVPKNLDENPAVEFDVELLPDGSLRGLRMRKSSGIAGFDEAVKRAIERSQPFPPDQTGTVPGRLTVVHKPKDQ